MYHHYRLLKNLIPNFVNWWLYRLVFSCINSTDAYYCALGFNSKNVHSIENDHLPKKTQQTHKRCTYSFKRNCPLHSSKISSACSSSLREHALQSFLVTFFMSTCFRILMMDIMDSGTRPEKTQQSWTFFSLSTQHTLCTFLSALVVPHFSHSSLFYFL